MWKSIMPRIFNYYWTRRRVIYLLYYTVRCDVNF